MKCVLGLVTLSCLTAYAQGRQGESLIQQLRAAEPGTAAVLENEALAREEAQAAIRLLRADRTDFFWPLLRQSADNTRRSYIVSFLGALRADPGLVLGRLSVEKDASVRRALVLSLGNFGPAQLGAVSLGQMVPTLLYWYRNDPDAGLHSAIEWL